MHVGCHDCTLLLHSALQPTTNLNLCTWSSVSDIGSDFSGTLNAARPTQSATRDTVGFRGAYLVSARHQKKKAPGRKPRIEIIHPSRPQQKIRKMPPICRHPSEGVTCGPSRVDLAKCLKLAIPELKFARPCHRHMKVPFNKIKSAIADPKEYKPF
ncbi:hypothetical protein NA57DRAFT_56292 [Rhizodiscina lignyota]|uniref:Uncharacterized protein n=1 Tax=Rhizodiscina lignyota TaxID=1504668 RepID=A0A9P4ID47_9PEZI|nr:hypothetical protein NA57DRAFT_56292 [Rhizodiscina lignyota]